MLKSAPSLLNSPFALSMTLLYNIATLQIPYKMNDKYNFIFLQYIFHLWLRKKGEMYGNLAKCLAI